MIKLHYYDKPNFGDALSPVLVAALSGQEVVHASHPRTANLVAVGSVLFAGGSLWCERAALWSVKGFAKMVMKALDIFRPTLNIWGSGLLCDTGATKVIPIRKCKVCAVRGKKTLEVLKRVGIVKEGEKVALGDPGLLYPMLINGRVDRENVEKCEVGVVAHYTDQEQGRQFVKELETQGKIVKFIDVNQADPLKTVAEIGSCKKIYSSSLHGLIVADAFGIPNEHIVWSNLGQSEQSQFKFEDYYSAWRDDVPTGESVMSREVYERLKKDLLESSPYAR